MGAGGLSADQAGLGRLPLLASARHGAASARRLDHVVEVVAALLDDFLGSALVLGEGVSRVLLAELEAADIIGEPLRKEDMGFLGVPGRPTGLREVPAPRAFVVFTFSPDLYL